MNKTAIALLAGVAIIAIGFAYVTNHKDDQVVVDKHNSTTMVLPQEGTKGEVPVKPQPGAPQVGPPAATEAECTSQAAVLENVAKASRLKEIRVLHLDDGQKAALFAELNRPALTAPFESGSVLIMGPHKEFSSSGTQSIAIVVFFDKDKCARMFMPITEQRYAMLINKITKSNI